MIVRFQDAGSSNRAHRLRRLAPVLAFAAAAFGTGLVLGARHEPSERRVAARFAAAWERGDHAAMYALLAEDVQREVSLRRFARAYRRAADRATLASVDVGRPRSAEGSRVAMDVTATTRIFGAITGTLVLDTQDREDGEPGIVWRAEHVFPGLHRGERLTRETEMPQRAAIQARDGTPIAQGEARLSQLGPLASEIAGRIGPAPPEREAELERRGLPEGTPVGLTGLERVFENRLAGTPGGVLKAGARVLARSEPRPGAAVRTTIDARIQEAAVTALAGRFGGIAVLRPSDGEILALAGIAYSAPQPPGSVFKIVTLAGLLDAGVVKRRAKFPVETFTTLEGVKLENANGEACGGSLANAFAHSCNSVFAPLGAKLGAERLVAAAERFGFNQDPKLAGAARSTIPAAGEIGDDLAVGSTAIGQGKVLATPLLMAEIAAAIAEKGRRPRPTLLKGAGGVAGRATSPETARFIARAMRSVVTDGTGVGAAVPGVRVAGKTGTAELRSTVSEDPVPPEPGAPPPEEDTTDTDAWFAAFAPMSRPRVAVSVLLVGQGAGGATAAPAAKTRARSRASPLNVEVDDARDAAAAPELELQRAVLERVRLDLEQQQRPLDHAVGGGRVGRRDHAVRRDRLRVVGEDVDVRVERERPVDVLLRVHDLEVVGRGQRLVGLVLDAQEHAEPRLLARRLLRVGREPLQVVAILDVGRVDVARDLDLVLQLVEVDVDALGLGLRDRLLLVAAAGGDEAAGQQGEEQGEASHQRGIVPSDPGTGPTGRPPWRARHGRGPPRGSTGAAATPCGRRGGTSGAGRSSP